jgi:hypothetical protein
MIRVSFTEVVYSAIHTPIIRTPRYNLRAQTINDIHYNSIYLYNQYSSNCFIEKDIEISMISRVDEILISEIECGVKINEQHHIELFKNEYTRYLKNKDRIRQKIMRRIYLKWQIKKRRKRLCHFGIKI